MSNLIKSAFFNVGQEDKRIIDSDSHVEEFIPNIFSAQINEYRDNADIDVQLMDDEIQKEESFQDGMSVIRIDDVLEEEKQKLEEENRQNAAKLIEEAKGQAEDIINEAQELAEGIKNDAYEEGLNQGLSEGRQKADEEAQILKKEFDQECSRRLEEIENREKSLEGRFADIMIGLISKITGIVCEDKKDVIVYLIDNALHNVSKSESITIRVSKEDIMQVDSNKDEFLSCLTSNTSLDIIEDDSLSMNQCIIETDNAIIDCSLDAQLDNLKEQIKMLVL